jgi:hypothetical protein
MQYDYSTHKTMDEANLALDDLFATGEVCEGEHPHIVRKRLCGRYRYVIVIGQLEEPASRPARAHQ